MMRKILIVPALFLVASCYNLKKGTRPVYFSADSTVFADSLFPEQAVYFNDFYGIMGNHYEDVELRKDEVVKGFALGTTLIGIDRDKALIYPKEHILVKGSYDDYHFTAVNGSEQRNRELMVFKVFKKLEKQPVLPQLTDYTLQSVLDLEQQQKEEIAKAEARSQLLFDSLLNAYAVSKKFKELTKGYISNRYDFSLIWI
ncbi:MAG TPA: hypothetical protein VEV15_13395, partial [Flavisolibacter sp.]|nr:hypothetical protein [Flavisolibacter sp.]